LIVGLFTAASGQCRADMGFPGMKTPWVTNRISTDQDVSEFVFAILRHKGSVTEKGERIKPTWRSSWSFLHRNPSTSPASTGAVLSRFL
jgi:hypothetical protein